MIIGIDPGANGALVRYDYRSGSLDIQDIPTWYQTVGNKKRSRIDAVALAEYFEMQKLCGAEIVMIEAVGGRPKQSASNAFVFGYGVGLIYMACIMARLPIETAYPAVWKKIMRLPGKRAPRKKDDPEPTKAQQSAHKKEAEGTIIQRADELFPDYTHMWRGAKGGYKVDRAEATLLARYCADHVIHTTRLVNLDASEYALAYRNADTGG